MLSHMFGSSIYHNDAWMRNYFGQCAKSQDRSLSPDSKDKASLGGMYCTKYAAIRAKVNRVPGKVIGEAHTGGVDSRLAIPEISEGSGP
jgi:hypothetical protein